MSVEVTSARYVHPMLAHIREQVERRTLDETGAAGDIVHRT